MSIYDDIPNRKEITGRIDKCRSEGGESLRFSGLYIKELPEEIKSFSNLKELDISYNKINELPDWIGNCRSLKKLNLRGNCIDSLPDSLGELKNLVFLDAGINHIKEISDNLKQLTSLEYLDLESLSNYKIKNLPDWIGELSALTFLNIRHCGFKELPESIKNLSNLKTFYFGANCLPELPQWLGSMTQLEELDISANEFFTIPDFIGNLKNLRSFFPGYSNRWEYQTRHHIISELDNRINELDKLPDFITELPRLVHLNLGHTGLKSVPENLKLLKLESLALDNNDLTEIPGWLGSMTSLQKINLSNNKKLKHLPLNFNNLHNLEEFNISKTSIGKFPECIREFIKLKKL